MNLIIQDVTPCLCCLWFVMQGKREPVSLVGEGERSVLMYTGPITSALFGFAPKPSNPAFNTDLRAAARPSVG